MDMLELYDAVQDWSEDNIEYDIPITKTTDTLFEMAADWELIVEAAFDLTGYTLNGNFDLTDTGITGGAISGYTKIDMTSGTCTATVAGTVDYTAAGTYDCRDRVFVGNVELVNSSGGNVTVQIAIGVAYTNTGPDITVEESTAVSILLPNIIDGSLVRLSNVDAGTGPGFAVEIDYQTISGGTGYSYVLTFTASFNYMIEVVYVDGATAKEPIVLFGAMTPAGLDLPTAQEDADNYNAICAELSTTGFDQDQTNGGSITADLANVQIDFDDPDGEFDIRLGIIWFYWRVTQIDALRIYNVKSLVFAPDQYNLIVDGELQLENTSGSLLVITNGNWQRKDGGNIIAATSDTIHWQGYLNKQNLAELAGQVDTQLSTTHGAGSWEGSGTGGGATAEEVRIEMDANSSGLANATLARKFLANKLVISGSAWTLYDDDETTVIATGTTTAAGRIPT
jgi:hypothetical protein